MIKHLSNRCCSANITQYFKQIITTLFQIASLMLPGKKITASLGQPPQPSNGVPQGKLALDPPLQFQL